MPKGSTTTWGLKDGHTRFDKFNGHMDWLAPKFHTQNAKAQVSLSFGPRLEFSFGIASAAAELYARMDMPGVDFMVGTKKSKFLRFSVFSSS
jgi:hypothetical protein